MKLTTATRKATIQTLLGFLLIFISSSFLITSLFLFLTNINGFPEEIIFEVYDIIYTIFGHNVLFILNNVPFFDYPDIFVKENMDVVSILAMFVLGRIMVNSSKHLSNRIRAFKSKSAQKSSMNPYKSGMNIYSSEFTLESKDSWYMHPIGLISLLISSIYVSKFIELINQVI